MLNILIVSTTNDAKCRMAMAEVLLNSLGKGMKITSATTNAATPDFSAIIAFLKDKGHDISEKTPININQLEHTTWDYIITFDQDAAQQLDRFQIKGNAKTNMEILHSYLGDPLDQSHQLNDLYQELYKKLFLLYRNSISDLIMPKCTCGANTFCRCE